MVQMHPGWSRTTRYFIFVLVLAAFIGLVFWMRLLIGPLIMAVLLAYILNPVVTLLVTWSRLQYRQAVRLVYFIFLLLLIAIPVTLAPVIVAQAQSLGLEFGRMGEELTAVLIQVEEYFGFELSLAELVVSIQAAMGEVFNIERAIQVIQSVTTNLVWVLVILITPYYLLQDWEKLREWLIGVAPPDYQSDVRRLYQEITIVWNNYLRGQLLLMLVIGISSAIGGAAVGLPGALLLGLLAGLLDVIPSLGPAVAMALAVAIAWFEGSTYLPISNTWFAILVLGIYMAIQTAENVWIRPRIMAYSLKMHPGLIFIAVVGALVLMGALTALIIIPLLGSIAILAHYIRCRFLNIDPWTQLPTVVSEDDESGESAPVST